MVQINRHDSILVKIINENKKMVSCYYTSAINETLQMFITAKEYETYCYFNDNSESISDEYLHGVYLVKDVYLILGSEEDIPAIEVVI